MIPTTFEYHAPESVPAALDLIGRYGDDCKILSGGQSLIPVLKLRLASPAAIIDIGRINSLDFIKVEGDVLRIGALSKHATLAEDALAKGKCPLLAETARQIGDQQVRNRGTIGGSVTHADPAADWPAAMLALNARMHLASKKGERIVEARDFFLDMLTSAAQTGEILTEISIPIPSARSSSCYLKVPQAASGFAIVGVAVQAEAGDGTWKDVRVAITGLGPKAFRAASTETLLSGKPTDEATIAAAAAKADAEAADAMEDIHASGEYRRHLARVYTKRALLKAAGITL